jgi:hypothetical protein
MTNFQPPPGFTKEEFETLLENQIAKSMLDAIISYLKKTADVMDSCGLKCMTASDLRRIALEMTTNGYQPQ